MAYTSINSEDWLVQTTVANHLRDALGWESVFAFNDETFGPDGTLGRADSREAVLTRDLRAAIAKLNPELPAVAIDEAVQKLTRSDFSRGLVQRNQGFYQLLRAGVLVSWRDAKGERRTSHARVIDFRQPDNNRFVAVRELKLTGLRTPHYNRRADIVCFVNGLPLVFIELKAVYKNVRAGFDGNLRDYMDESVVSHAFDHNAFLVVANGDDARYGSITSGWDHFAEWKRNDERDKGTPKGPLRTEVLLNGMLARDRLLDLVENFILFDASRPGAVRKVIARNQQVLGVNLTVASVLEQEELKRRYPIEQRITRRIAPPPHRRAVAEKAGKGFVSANAEPLEILERAHPKLGQLGVFWHTQGSGKSYSMIFLAEKVRRTVPGNFTFVLMTDRTDLDSQIYKSFIGCGAADEKAPRASSGKDLAKVLGENHRYVFSVIHKFNQDVDPDKPYSRRDDIIVISDEAHRTQGGKLARNMRLALPYASFLGFTGTPLLTHDQLTRKIFGSYVSRYDFKRSVEDGSTVRLVYENRGEKLGIALLDLNDRIAEVIEKSQLDPDEEAQLEKLLGKDYEVITADERLMKVADDFVEHCTTRWESGKSMLVCIDKVTCARMHKLIVPRWEAKLAALRAAAEGEGDADQQKKLEGQARWIEETLIELIISEAQGEVEVFKKWKFDIIPHRARMKQGFETPDGRRVDVESAFKDPAHPFRVAIVCAMWLTGFDVECLSTLYLDKPMRAHTLMQAIARANRVYPGKDFGLIVDYNGMLKSLRAALAQYALGDDGLGDEDVAAPIDDRVHALRDAIMETEAHLSGLGFDAAQLKGAKGFTRIQALADAVEAVYTSDESKRRFEIMARVVFTRFKALVAEPSALTYAVRHDDIEAIYKKLTERRDAADVTDVLQALHRIVNEAIRTHSTGDDQTGSKLFDLSAIDLEKLREEFAKKVSRKASAVQDVRDLVERKLQLMLQQNPLRMDYYRRYSEIVADYNREKDRVTIEETFARLLALASSLDAEQRRAVEEGLTEEELALFDLLKKDDLTKADRERLKAASRDLIASLLGFIAPLDQWTQKEKTRAEVEVFILDNVHHFLPSPPFNDDEKQAAAKRAFEHVWQQSASGLFPRKVA